MRSVLDGDLSDLPDAGPERATSDAAPPAGHDQDLAHAEDADVAVCPDSAADAEWFTQMAEAPRPRRGRWVLGVLAALAFLLALRGITQHVAETFAFSAVLGWIDLVLILALVVLVSSAVMREVRAYRRLGQCERLRALCGGYQADPLDAAAEVAFVGELLRWLDSLAGRGPQLLADAVQRVRLGAGDDARGRVWVEEVERGLLEPMDAAVQASIRREALTVGMGTAVSPYGFLDAILVLWRNVRLVRRVAQTYQVRPGTWGTYLIIRRALAALAGPLGQGLTNATLTVRLGLLVQAECRPLPMPPDKARSAAGLLARTVPEQIRALLRRRGDESPS